MKKIAFYCIVAVLTCLTACQGKEWDTEDELTILTVNWCQGFVDYALDKIGEDSIFSNNDKTVVTKSVRGDTICHEFHHSFNSEDGDSLNVITTLYQFGDSSIVTVDGYRYSNKYYAHLYTLEPGIINYEGKFHVDYYEMGKTTPWAWGEVTYQKRDNKYRPYSYDDRKVGRY